MSMRRESRSYMTPRSRPWWLRGQRAARQSATDARRRDWPAWLGVSTAIIAALGALVFNAVSATSTNRQMELARQGQLTDRYSKAVEQLGSDSTDVRLGGIYALERLMRDSPSDQPTIVEVLAAFIRGNANKPASPSPTPTAPLDVNAVFAQRPADILAAITVLGRRDTRHDTSDHPVDLSFANLAGLNLISANLAGANLTGVNLQGTLLTNAKLANAILAVADLTDARLSSADLTCADLFGANLTRTTLSSANLTRADLRANLTGTNLDNANLTGANLGDSDMSNTTGTPRPTHSTSEPPPQCDSR